MILSSAWTRRLHSLSAGLFGTLDADRLDNPGVGGGQRVFGFEVFAIRVFEAVGVHAAVVARVVVAGATATACSPTAYHRAKALSRALSAALKALRARSAASRIRSAARVLSSRPLALRKAEMALLYAPCSAEGSWARAAAAGQQDARADARS